MKPHLRLAAAAVSAAALATTGLGSALAAPSAEPIPVHRVQGNDRITTAIAASQVMWDNAGTKDGVTAGAVVISRYDDYADALGGSALAGAVGGPLLLTRPAYIDAANLKEVTRLLGKNGTVYLLGGTGAISAAAEKTLRDKGYAVKRLAGSDRYDTSVKVAKEVRALTLDEGATNFVFATTGQNFPDGLAAGATAAGWGAAVVLTKDGVLPKPVKNYLDAERAAGTLVFAVGGAAAKAPFRWTDTFVGKDRYETAALIADSFWGNPDDAGDDPTWLGLATGENWPDALAGGALVASSGPLLLTQRTVLTGATKAVTRALVKSASPSTVELGFVMGGAAAVTDTVKSAFATALNP